MGTFKQKRIIKTNDAGVVTTVIEVGDPRMILPENDGRTFDITKNPLKDDIKLGEYQVAGGKLQKRLDSDIQQDQEAGGMTRIQKQVK